MAVACVGVNAVLDYYLSWLNLKRFQKLLAATVYWVCQWGLDVVFN